jgi:hypothetical protein
MPSNFSFVPSYAALFATLLALTFIVVGVVLSQSDMHSRRPASITRSRRRIAATMPHSTIPDKLFHFVTFLLEEIVLCRRSNATIPSVAFFYIATDALAFLVAPDGNAFTDEAAFSSWIDTYMNLEGRPYLYPSHELYSARLELLCDASMRKRKEDHAVSSSISYISRGSHEVAKGIQARIQVISVPILLQDFEFAIRRFVEALQPDEFLLSRATTRVALLRSIHSFKESSE